MLFLIPFLMTIPMSANTKIDENNDMSLNISKTKTESITISNLTYYSANWSQPIKADFYFSLTSNDTRSIRVFIFTQIQFEDFATIASTSLATAVTTYQDLSNFYTYDIQNGVYFDVGPDDMLNFVLTNEHSDVDLQVNYTFIIDDTVSNNDNNNNIFIPGFEPIFIIGCSLIATIFIASLTMKKTGKTIA